MTIIGWLMAVIVPAMVSVGFVGVLAFWVSKLGYVARSTLAAIAGPLLVNAIGIGNGLLSDEPEYTFLLLYLLIYLVASIPVSFFMTKKVDQIRNGAIGVFD